MRNANDLSKDEILELIGQLTELASTDDGSRVLRASDRCTSRDPLVRNLAAVAIHDLHKRMSYRDIAKMFNTSHSRVHQLHKDLEKRATPRPALAIR